MLLSQWYAVRCALSQAAAEFQSFTASPFRLERGDEPEPPAPLGRLQRGKRLVGAFGRCPIAPRERRHPQESEERPRLGTVRDCRLQERLRFLEGTGAEQEPRAGFDERGVEGVRGGRFERGKRTTRRLLFPKGVENQDAQELRFAVVRFSGKERVELRARNLEPPLFPRSPRALVAVAVCGRDREASGGVCFGSRGGSRRRGGGWNGFCRSRGWHGNGGWGGRCVMR